MKQYLDLVRHIRANGENHPDRTGTGTRSVFGYQMRFDLRHGFPLVTTKRVPFRAVVVELLWMLKGDTNTKYLTDNGVTIWDEWADQDGDLGPIYGKQWRGWDNHVDQIATLIENLRNDPFSRRHVVSAWNVSDLPDPALLPHEQIEEDRMALAPCHALFQFYVNQDRQGHRYLSCQLYQRSADVFLGVPFNIAAYSLLTHMIAHHLDMRVGEFIWTGGDCHLYRNHEDQVKTLLTRTPGALPTLRLNYPQSLNLWDVKHTHIDLEHYYPEPTIPAPVAI